MFRKTSPSGMRIGVYFVLVLALGCVAFTQARYKFFHASEPRAPEHKTRVGETLPDFEIQDLSGKVWRSSDLKGKVLYANVWASW